jgi:plastocyanin
LAPIAGTADRVTARGPARQHLRLLQKHKRFEPHLLVVPVGAAVEFPNLDPFFHNVFSLFEGKRFDLGLYEAGTTRIMRFDRPGICYIFCNIHPEMSAIVFVMATSYYGVSNGAGDIVLPDVPPGRYQLQVWHERSLPEALKTLSREITISEDSRSLGIIRLSESGTLMVTHKNKYGRDYDAPTPASPLYEQP